MAYEVPPLPYDYDALEPHIDEQTMRLHHDKHHQAYVDKANAALDGHRARRQADRGGHRATSTRVPEDKQGAVRNNGGGHLNHSLFWESMSPDGGGAPDGDLAQRDRRRVRLLRRLQGAVRGRRRRALRLGLGVARPRRRRAGDHQRRPTRTTRSPTARRRCWATTSGSTPTTSSTRTAARSTSRRGGTS